MASRAIPFFPEDKWGLREFWQRAREEVIRAAAIGCGIGALMLAIVIALAAYTASLPNDALKSQIAAGFASQSLKPEASWTLWDVRHGAHQTNDCMILFQALNDSGSVMERAITPVYIPIDQIGACQSLQQLTAGIQPPETIFYHQYAHAQTSVARLLVPVFGVQGLREVYRLIITFAVILGFALPALALTKGQPLVPNLIWLISFAVIGRYFGLESFAQSLGHAPSDLIILGFLLTLIYRSANGGMSGQQAIILAALFGALTISFELLTGGIPIGIALIIGLYPFVISRDFNIPRVTIASLTAFIAAVGTVVIGKVIAIIAVFGTSPVIEVVTHFMLRMGGGEASAQNPSFGFLLFFARIWSGLEGLAAGMHWLVVGTITLAVALGIWGYGQLRHTPCPAFRFRVRAMAASTLVIPLWMLVLSQHSAQHSWYMNRMLVWPIIVGLSLFALALIEQRRAGDQSAVGAGCAK